ncbi:hypothetical protein AB9H26_19280 [Yersinia enterocolitica]|uniref:hypothetical protein n=1 Tax=Yersinia enterocolitica TaxID=630 RepID=UPI003CFEDABC
MKALDSFTVERLEEILNFDLPRHPAALEEIVALARIALAAKRAEPVGYLEQNHLDYLRSGSDADIWPEGGAGDIPVYLAPQLNSPEIPEGWKLVPIELTAEMAQAAKEAHEGESYLPYSIYRAMLAAAPEKPL